MVHEDNLSAIKNFAVFVLLTYYQANEYYGVVVTEPTLCYANEK